MQASPDWIKVGTLVATLPDTWCYGVSARAGRPGVSVLWDNTFDLQLLSRCDNVYNYQSNRSFRYTVHAPGTLRSYETNKPLTSA